MNSEDGIGNPSKNLAFLEFFVMLNLANRAIPANTNTQSMSMSSFDRRPSANPSMTGAHPNEI